MRHVFSGMFVSVLGATGGDQVGTGGLTTWLAIAVSGGVLSLLVSKWLNRNQDEVGLGEQAMKMVRESLQDVEVMRLEIARISKRLQIVQADLEAANARITSLKQELQGANEDREKLIRELAENMRRRDELQQEVAELRARVSGMEAMGRGGIPGPQGPPGPQGQQGEPG